MRLVSPLSRFSRLPSHTNGLLLKHGYDYGLEPYSISNKLKGMLIVTAMAYFRFGSEAWTDDLNFYMFVFFMVFMWLPDFHWTRVEE